MIGLVGHLIWSGYREAIRVAETTTRSYAALLETKLGDTLRRADAELQSLQRTIPPSALSQDAVSQYPQLGAALKARLIYFPEVAGMIIFDAKGDVLYTSYESASRPDIADRSHFRILRDNPGAKLFFSEVIPARDTGRLGFTVARPLRDEQGVFRGVVVALIEIDHFLRIFQSLNVGTKGNIAIYRSDDFRQVLRWPELKGRLNAPLPQGNPAQLALAAGNKTATTDITTSTDNTTRIYSFHVLDPYPFFVAVGVAREDVLAGWWQRSITTGLSTLLLVGLLLGLLYRIGRADAVRARLAAIVDASNDAIVSRDLHGKVMSWNRSAEALFGYTAAEIVGCHIDVLVPPARRHELRIGKETAPVFDSRSHDSTRLTKDGRLLDVSISAAPIKDAAGNVNAIALVFRDITERKQAEQARSRLAAAAEGSSDAIFIRDTEGKIAFWNQGAQRLYGYSPEEVLGKDSTFLVPPDQLEDRAKNSEILKNGGVLENHETVRLRKDATPVDVSISVSHVKDDSGKAIGLATIARDISARKQAGRTQAQLAAIVESSDDAIVSRAPDDTIVSWNAAAERMFGWRAEETLGRKFKGLLSQTPDIRREGRFEKILRGEPVPSSLEDIRRRKDGSTVHVQTTMSAIRDEQGKILFVSCIMRDVTERVKAERHIEHLATKDALTGLSNRGMLMEQMHTAIARAARSQTQLVVIFVDLDHFKAVNDTLGHAAGDALLRECAKRLTDCVREGDIVARLGGDEFVVILTDVTDATIVTPIADRMLKLLTTPYHLHGNDAQTSASIGICYYPTDGKDVATLMKVADIAMYHAKELGRDNYQFYAEEMNQRMLRRQQLERELHTAVENNEFVLHYQPQVVVATGEIHGAESLIRWQHPTRGLLSPAEFISVAEETGLIVPLGKWILNHACSTIKTWRANGVGIPYIVVNVSAGQLSADLVTSVRQALVDHGIEPGWLMLEITETMLMEHVEESIAILRRIREMGIRIAMDDFGTGYSSLSVLQRLPLDTLKIDRSFVSAIDDEANNARACAIIGAIIAIAKELNLNVVAEGVETTTQLAFLRTVNCDTYQGYLYSMPVDTITLEQRYAAPVKSVLEDEEGRAITMTTFVTLELRTDEIRI